MSNKKLNEGIRGAKEGVAECWGDSAQVGQGEKMSVTISMPGKNISVTSDSVDEIANILKLAGINVGGTSAEEPTVAIAVEPSGMGGEAPEAELPPMGAQTMGQQPEVEMEPEVEEGNEFTGALAKAKAEHKDKFEVDGKEYDVEEATQTPSSWEDSEGNKHPATRVQGKSYGNQDREEEDDEVDESARILALAGVTEAQSAAQKAAFKAMIDKKNGNKSEEKSEEDDKEEEVEESSTEAPATSNSIYGQGVYEAKEDDDEKSDDTTDKNEEMDESARILKLAGITEWANSPQGKADDKGTVSSKLPSNVGQGGGNSQFGQNRANGQGENPMSPSNTANTATINVEEAFEIAMGEYRKFVSESIASKK
jgi:hypothetical protein